MKQTTLHSAFILALSLMLLIPFHACDKKALSDVIVWVEMDGKPIVNETDVTFKAKISNPGQHKIDGYGFEWKKDTRIIGRHHVDAPDFKGATFELTVDYALAENEEYTVRAYVQSPSQRVSTPPSSFTAKGSLPPVVDDYFPKQGRPGDTLVITGSRFPSVNYTGRAVAFRDFAVLFDILRVPTTHISYGRIEAIISKPLFTEPPYDIGLEIPGHTLILGEFTFIE